MPHSLIKITFILKHFILKRIVNLKLFHNLFLILYKNKKIVALFLKTSILFRIFFKMTKKLINTDYEIFTQKRPYQHYCQRGHYSYAGAFLNKKYVYT